MNTRGGGVASLPYKECPTLFLQQDIEDQMVQQMLDVFFILEVSNKWIRSFK